MNSRRVLAALVLSGAGLHAQPPEPPILRPITLPQGRVDLTIHGTYTDWDFSHLGLEEAFPSLTGETVALGVDFGVTDHVQLGLATALPVHPGLAFGSILVTGAVALEPRCALRLDAGYERTGVNGQNAKNEVPFHRFFGGLGLPVKIPISAAVAFVSGSADAVGFGHFNNIGVGGMGIYYGVSQLGSSVDVLVVEVGDDGRSSTIGVNLPLGLLLQPDPGFAFTLQTGYSGVFTSGSSTALHYLPLKLEAVVTPDRTLDLGARFFVDGFVARTGGGLGGNFDYFDTRAFMLWLRVHA